jgi:alpha-methylacyl-CoA racemase
MDAARSERPGALAGCRVVKLGGIGPGPFAAMWLADMGADVVCVDRIGEKPMPPVDVMRRNQRAVALDLKSPAGKTAVLALVERADVLIEGFRPGVAERLGLGPNDCMDRNRRLVYARMTGRGQDGPWAQAPGHDIDYIALTGALHQIGPPDLPPVPPLNLVGDFGGGAMFLVAGVLAALIERQGSGRGQVVDAAMVDGAALLMTSAYSMIASGMGSGARGDHTLAGGCYYYSTYETADGRYVAVGAIEPQFYRQFVSLLGLDDDLRFAEQRPAADWPEMRKRVAEVFLTKTRDEWSKLAEGTEACVAPVLSPLEAPTHRHNMEREVFSHAFGIVQPAPAPRLERTPGTVRLPPAEAGQDTADVLADWAAR